MKQYTKDEISRIIRGREGQQVLDLRGSSFRGLDLQGFDFSFCDLTGSDFRGCNLSGSDFCGSNLTDCRIEGACLYLARLEKAVLTGIRFDASTQYYAMRCPAEGAFLAYKLCFNYRLVRLLIPADAKRSSATNNACRCSKAKVLSIKSCDGKRSFTEANAFVDHNFVYRVGEVAHASGFNENRWVDSTTGIHFFMTAEEAFEYMKQ